MAMPRGLQATRPSVTLRRRLVAVLCAAMLWTVAGGPASAQMEGSAGRGPETPPVIGLSGPLPAPGRHWPDTSAQTPVYPGPVIVPQVVARTVETVIPAGLPRAGDGSTAMTFTGGRSAD
jgi:hypothetical protein